MRLDLFDIVQKLTGLDLRQRGLKRNGIFALMQSVIMLFCMFVSYRLVIEEEGVSGLGLWALLLVFTSAAATFDVSGATALARSVARQDQDFNDVALADVVHTVLLTSLAMNGLMVALFFAFLPLLLPNIVNTDQMGDALRLMPWVAGMTVLTPLAVGTSAAIDGLMRTDLRAKLSMAGAVTGLMVSALAISRFGIIGFALGQFVQQAIIITGGWLILRRHIPGMGWFPVRWRMSVARQTTGYALKLNFISILGMTFDPLAKFCLNYSGGTHAVGIYELASKLTLQLRGLIVASAVPLIPAFATFVDKDEEFLRLLERTQKLMIVASLGTVMLSLAAAPIMTIALTGEFSADITQYSAFLAAGWGINMLATPLYMVAQAQGYLRWNIVGHAVIGLCIALCSLILIGHFGEYAVLAGVFIGLALSALATALGNALAFGAMARLKNLLWLHLAAIAAMCLLSVAAWVLV